MVWRVSGLPLLALIAAAAPNPYLESARAAYARLDCDQVLADTELALKVPTNDVDTRLAIYDFAGRCHVALGHGADADQAFTQMLKLDPQAELDPALSPKIREAFHAAKLKAYPSDYVAWSELSRGEGLVRATLIDPWRRVSSVVLGRADGAGVFQESPLSPSGDVYVANVGDAPWFLEARGRKNVPLALLGKKEVPKVVAVLQTDAAAAGPTPGQKNRRAVGWVGVAAGGAAVVSGIILFAVASASRTSAERQAWADDASRLEQESNTEAGAGHGLFWGGLALFGVGFALTF